MSERAGRAGTEKSMGWESGRRYRLKRKNVNRAVGGIPFASNNHGGGGEADVESLFVPLEERGELTRGKGF